jgi:hypothetical protein
MYCISNQYITHFMKHFQGPSKLASPGNCRGRSNPFAFVKTCLFQIKIWIFLLLLITSCHHSTVEKPEKLIDENTMIDMLADIHLAESAFSHLRHQDSLVEKSSSVDLYYSVLDKYQIQDSVFEKSLVFYASQPRRFEQMYRKTMNKLSEMEQEYSGRKQEMEELELQQKPQ